MRFGWVNPLLLGLCGLVAQTAAKATSITTQSVEYCGPFSSLSSSCLYSSLLVANERRILPPSGEAQIVLVERFAVSFFPGNNTLTCAFFFSPNCAAFVRAQNLG